MERRRIETSLGAPAPFRPVERWAWERFGDEAGGLRGDVLAAQSTHSAHSEFSDAAQLVEACGASNGPERALCVGYFLQEVGGRPGFSGQELNSVLKHLGHPLSNVTATLGSLRAQKPALVMQVSKAGRSQQARKTYRLTVAGLESVRQMVRRAETEVNAA